MILTSKGAKISLLQELCVILTWQLIGSPKCCFATPIAADASNI